MLAHTCLSWPEVDPSWPKLAQVGPSWSQVGSTWTLLEPSWPQLGATAGTSCSHVIELEEVSRSFILVNLQSIGSDRLAPIGQSAGISNRLHRLVEAIGRSAVADPIAGFWTADRLWQTQKSRRHKNVRAKIQCRMHRSAYSQLSWGRLS